MTKSVYTAKVNKLVKNLYKGRFMECELCGKKADRLKKVRIDGAIMAVCPQCEHFGTPLENYRNTITAGPRSFVTNNSGIRVIIPRQNTHSTPRKTNKKIDIDKMEIDPEYSSIIRAGRERMGISQDDFAAKIKEKRTLIAGIERGSLKPDLKTAKKIEVFLKVKLVEKY